MLKRKNTEQFILEAKAIYGDKYDYSEVEYTNNKNSVDILCLKHNEPFKQSPYRHLIGQEGCKICLLYKQGRSQESVIDKFIKIHGDKYDYSKVDYKGNRILVDIYCKDHDEWFKQMPTKHLDGKTTCKECRLIKARSPQAKMLEAFKLSHGDTYDYSNTTYKDKHTEIAIGCKKHGQFFQSPFVHRRGAGCPKCASESVGFSKRLSQEEVLKGFKGMHGDRYDYSATVYVNRRTPILIRCKEHNFVFSQSQPSHRKGAGCPICNQSRGEARVENHLRKKELDYRREFTFNNCRDKGLLRFDFAIIDTNGNIEKLIEYDGKFHYEPIKVDNNLTDDEVQEAFKDRLRKDQIKNDYCKDNNIPLLRVPYWDFDNIEEILTKELKGEKIE